MISPAFIAMLGLHAFTKARTKARSKKAPADAGALRSLGAAQLNQYLATTGPGPPKCQSSFARTMSDLFSKRVCEAGKLSPPDTEGPCASVVEPRSMCRYSAPSDQFGRNIQSKPAPTVQPPLVVESDRVRCW